MANLSDGPVYAGQYNPHANLGMAGAQMAQAEAAPPLLEELRDRLAMIGKSMAADVAHIHGIADRVLGNRPPPPVEPVNKLVAPTSLEGRKSAVQQLQDEMANLYVLSSMLGDAAQRLSRL